MTQKRRGKAAVSGSISKRVLVLSLSLVSTGLAHTQQPIYLNPAAPREQRAEDLLSRMKLPEKIGQMNMPCCYLRVFGDSHSENVEFIKNLVRGAALEGMEPSGGFCTLANHVFFEVLIGQCCNETTFAGSLPHR